MFPRINVYLGYLGPGTTVLLGPKGCFGSLLSDWSACRHADDEDEMKKQGLLFHVTFARN